MRLPWMCLHNFLRMDIITTVYVSKSPLSMFPYVQITFRGAMGGPGFDVMIDFAIAKKLNATDSNGNKCEGCLGNWYLEELTFELAGDHYYLLIEGMTPCMGPKGHLPMNITGKLFDIGGLPDVAVSGWIQYTCDGWKKVGWTAGFNASFTSAPVIPILGKFGLPEFRVDFNSDNDLNMTGSFGDPEGRGSMNWSASWESESNSLEIFLAYGEPGIERSLWDLILPIGGDAVNFLKKNVLSLGGLVSTDITITEFELIIGIYDDMSKITVSVDSDFAIMGHRDIPQTHLRVDADVSLIITTNPMQLDVEYAHLDFDLADGMLTFGATYDGICEDVTAYGSITLPLEWGYFEVTALLEFDCDEDESGVKTVDGWSLRVDLPVVMIPLGALGQFEIRGMYFTYDSITKEVTAGGRFFDLIDVELFIPDVTELNAAFTDDDSSTSILDTGSTLLIYAELIDINQLIDALGDVSKNLFNWDLPLNGKSIVDIQVRDLRIFVATTFELSGEIRIAEDWVLKFEVRSIVLRSIVLQT